MSEEKLYEGRERYRITVKGILDVNWSDWFDGFTVKHKGEDETILEGLVVDQADLHGLLAKIRDLGLILRSVESLSPGKKSGGLVKEEK